METRKLPGSSRRLKQERPQAVSRNEPHCSRSILTEDPREPKAETAYDAESESEYDCRKSKGPAIQHKGRMSDTRRYEELLKTWSRRNFDDKTRGTKGKPRDKGKGTAARAYFLEGTRSTGSRIRNPGSKWGMPNRAYCDDEIKHWSPECQLPPRRGQVPYERCTPPEPKWSLGYPDDTEDDLSDSDDLSGKLTGRCSGQNIGCRNSWDYSLIPTKYGYRTPGVQPCIDNHPWRRGYSSRISRRVAYKLPGPHGQGGLANNFDNYPDDPPHPRPAPAVVVDPEPDLVQHFAALAA